MLTRTSRLTGLGLLLLACAGRIDAQEARLLILTPRDLAPAAEELARHRRAGGLRAQVERVRDATPQELKARIREVHAETGGALRYLLLMGDAPAPGDPEGRVRIPPRLLEAAFADERWPHAKELASDTWYGMLDADLVPELAVGRLPADELSEARRMVARIVAYEASHDFGEWRRRLAIVAGTAGFGTFEDSLIEATFRRYIAKFIDPAYDVKVTYANPDSPYGYHPEHFSAKVREQLDAGALVMAYVGHGRARALGTIWWRERSYPIFRLADARRISIARGAPVAVFLACSTGHFDHPRCDCLAEVLLKQDRGPVAVLASSRICQPYPDAIIGRELIEHLTAPTHRRIGDVLQAVRASLAHPGGSEQKIIDLLACLVMRPSTLAPCRADHIHLYNLLGDPCMPLGRARGTAALRAPLETIAGRSIEITCNLDREYSGEALVTLEAQRGQLIHPLLKIAGLEDEALAKAMAENWTRANDQVAIARRIRVQGARFTARLQVPAAGLPEGEYHLKVFVSDGQGCALGASPLRLRDIR